jgi:dinuclear metal center YbgI/SA1388 family protein
LAARDDIIGFARELLDLDKYPDYGPMGLQVVGADEVTKVAASVSSSREVFKGAAATGAQLLIVHHGLFWENEPRIIGPTMRGRLEVLFEHNLNLAAYHLALDAHPELGNNILVARALGVQSPERAHELGFGGDLDTPVSLGELIDRLRDATGREPLVFDGGPTEIKRVAVITGGAARYFPEIAAMGYDAFVTGEPAEPTMALSRELGAHYLAGGHYATETLGIKALAERLAETFDLEWEFVDVPNPV